MRNLLVCLIIAASVVACKHNPPIVVPPEAKVTLSKEALEPCEPLVGLPTLTYADLEKDMQTILGVSAINAITFSACKNKQNDSIKLLKQFANIKEKADVQKPVQAP